MTPRVRLSAPLLKVSGMALLVGCYSFLTFRKGDPPFNYIPHIPATLDAALSFAMALVLAFRVNRAYERWWEARSIWGTLVNVSRNIAVKVQELVETNEQDRVEVRNSIVAFCYGLKEHLHDEAKLQDLPGFEHSEAKPKHVPSHIVRSLYRKYDQWLTQGKLNQEQLWVLDSDTRVLLDVCGGCERIRNTLMSVSWRFFTWQCIFLYILILPWGLEDDIGGWTIPISTIIAYFVMAGEGIAHYVEEPFGLQEDHLDLDAMCHGIDVSVSEILEVELNSN